MDLLRISQRRFALILNRLKLILVVDYLKEVRETMIMRLLISQKRFALILNRLKLILIEV